jgi:glutathionylspermidine synthase
VIETARVVPLACDEPLAMPGVSRALGHDYFIWDAYLAGQKRVDLHPLVLTADLHERAMRAAEAVVKSVDAVAAKALASEAEAVRYKLAPDIAQMAAASHAGGEKASLMRVDLLLGADEQWFACEVNADCPGGHNEAYGLPRLARQLGFARGHDPTRVLEDLADELVRLSGGPGSPKGLIAITFATAYADDLQVCALVERAVNQRKGRVVRAPFMAIKGDGDGVSFRGERVSVLYRFLPLEFMEGAKNVDAIARALEKGTLTSVTRASAIYAQSKFAFARAWALADDLPPDVGRAIERYLPESYDLSEIPQERLVAERAQWVMKRAFGRVGDEVLVGALHSDEDWAHATRLVRAHVAIGEVWIAQRFVPQRFIETPWGNRLVTLGVYVQNGRANGYFARVTPESHVSHDALVIPTFVLDATAAGGGNA